MKKKLTAIIAAMAAMAITTTAFAFTDTNGLNDTQMNALNNAVENGIITGYEDDTVRPYGNLTRAEFAAMLCRAFHYNSDSSCTFADSASHWASAYIQACVERGAINGIGGNLFDPEAPVTFNQAAKIVSIVGGMTSGIDIDSLGGYPLAYLTVGQSNGLFENLTYGMTGEDYSLSRIDAITMIENVNINPSNTEANTITREQAETYVPAHCYGQFSNLGENEQTEMRQIVLNAFMSVITEKTNFNEALSQMMKEINNANFSYRSNLIKKCEFALKNALDNFNNAGYHIGVVIVD